MITAPQWKLERNERKKALIVFNTYIIRLFDHFYLYNVLQKVFLSPSVHTKTGENDIKLTKSQIISKPFTYSKRFQLQ